LFHGGYFWGNPWWVESIGGGGRCVVGDVLGGSGAGGGLLCCGGFYVSNDKSIGFTNLFFAVLKWKTTEPPLIKKMSTSKETETTTGTSSVNATVHS
jgi:hypothetical protein